MNKVPALNQSYVFEDGKIVFEDGVSYSINEAVMMARDRLTDEDIQAIHLVKRIFGGEIIVPYRNRVESPVYEPDDRKLQIADCKLQIEEKPRSLSEISDELGEPPLLNGGMS